jgi:hypothetical protein
MTNRLLRINADDYSTKHMVIFWIHYIALVIAISLLTLACNLIHYSVPPTFVTFQNKDMVGGTSLQGCPNPIGFDGDNMVYCNPISPTNPITGLLLR